MLQNKSEYTKVGDEKNEQIDALGQLIFHINKQGFPKL